MKKYMVKTGCILAVTMLLSITTKADIGVIEPLAVQSYSKEFNVSEKEAERRLTITSQLDYITQKLNEQFGDSIASVYFDNGQDFKLVVRTTKKGNTQKQVMSLTDQLSKQYELPIEVIANSPRNFRAIKNIIDNQSDRVARQYDGFQLAAYDPQKDAIYLAFYQPDTSKQNEIKAKLQKISGMDVVLDFLRSPIVQQELVGGGKIEYPGSVGACTAGFTGTRNNVKGVLTAAHCIANTPTSYVDNAGVKYTVGVPYTDYSVNHDIAFIPVNSTVISGEVYRQLSNLSYQPYQSNLKITGTAVAQVQVDYNGNYVGGTPLCHTGQTTGFSCGVTTQINAGVASFPGCSASLKDATAYSSCAKNNVIVRGKSLLSEKGDSGGPVFDSYGKAYAILSGGGVETMLVSPIRYAEAMGFILKTGN